MAVEILRSGFGRIARLISTTGTRRLAVNMFAHILNNASTLPSGWTGDAASAAASGAGGRFNFDSLAVPLPASVPAATRTPSSIGDWIVFSFALKS